MFIDIDPTLLGQKQEGGGMQPGGIEVSASHVTVTGSATPHPRAVVDRPLQGVGHVLDDGEDRLVPSSQVILANSIFPYIISTSSPINKNRSEPPLQEILNAIMKVEHNKSLTPMVPNLSSSETLLFVNGIKMLRDWFEESPTIYDR